MEPILHLSGTSDDVESTALALIPEHDTEAPATRTVGTS